MSRFGKGRDVPCLTLQRRCEVARQNQRAVRERVVGLGRACREGRWGGGDVLLRFADHELSA